MGGVGLPELGMLPMIHQWLRMFVNVLVGFGSWWVALICCEEQVLRENY